MTNILSAIWSTYYLSMEEFDTFAEQIRDFLRKDLAQLEITEFLHLKLTNVRELHFEFVLRCFDMLL